jgi:hypothetical protein
MSAPHYFNRRYHARFDGCFNGRYTAGYTDAFAGAAKLPPDDYMQIYHGRTIYIPRRDRDSITELLCAPGLQDMDCIEILRAFYEVAE